MHKDEVIGLPGNPSARKQLEVFKSGESDSLKILLVPLTPAPARYLTFTESPVPETSAMAKTGPTPWPGGFLFPMGAQRGAAGEVQAACFSRQKTCEGMAMKGKEERSNTGTEIDQLRKLPPDYH